MKRRILHVITSMNRGGAESMLARLLPALDPNRLEHRVICLREEGPVAQNLRDRDIPVYCLGIRGLPLAPLRMGPVLEAFSRSWRPDIIQGWMYHGNLAAFILAKVWPTRPCLLWNVRSSLDDLRAYRRTTRLLIQLEAWLSGRVDRILYNSSSSMRQHEAVGFDPRRSLWIPNGFDLAQFHPDAESRASVRRELGLPSEAFLLGHFARFHPEKNHMLLLEAMEILPASIHLALAGSGQQDGVLRRIVEQKGLADRVHLLGERTDMPRLTAALDLAVSPSRNEGFPNVVGEALACGVPCIGAAVGDTAALIGTSGMVIPPGDIRALTEAIQCLLIHTPDQRTTMGRLARERVRAQYSLEGVAARYDKLYEACPPDRS